MVRTRETAARGAAAVEFALIAPLLLLLVFGIIDYGVMLSFRQSVSQSAAEGARAAAVSPAGQSPVENARRAVTDALQGRNLTCTDDGDLLDGATDVGDCVVAKGQATAADPQCRTYPTAPTGAGVKDCVTVTVSYEYADHPTGPKLPLVPLPGRISYTGTSEVS